MACQPAIEVGIFLLVTLDALLHAPDFLRQALKFLYLSVAFLTGNFTVDMALVVKQHVLGHIIYFDPGGRRIGVKIFVFLFDPGMVGDNIFVAVQTFFDCRDSRMIGIGHIRVTVLTLDLFDPAVDSVAERDRLLRSDGAVRPIPIKENEHRNSQAGN